MKLETTQEAIFSTTTKKKKKIMTRLPVGQLLHRSLTMFSVMFAFHYPNSVVLRDNYKTL